MDRRKFLAATALAASGVAFLPIPDNYYDDLATRFDIARDLLAGIALASSTQRADNDAAVIILTELKEQAALIGSPNQIEAVRAGMEERPGCFADGE